MAGILKPDADARGRTEDFIIFPGFDKRRHRFGILGCVKRRCIRFHSRALQSFVFSGGFHLLDMRAVQKQYFEQIAGRFRGVNGPPKTILRHAGQQSRMVDMRVGDNKEINPGRVIGCDIQVASFNGLGSLMHAAINGKTRLICFNNITRAGDGSCGPEKFYLHELSLYVPRWRGGAVHRGWWRVAHCS